MFSSVCLSFHELVNCLTLLIIKSYVLLARQYTKEMKEGGPEAFPLFRLTSGNTDSSYTGSCVGDAKRVQCFTLPKGY